MRRALACMLVTLACSLDGARARADDGWVGRRVVLKLGVALRTGDPAIEDEARSREAPPQGGERAMFRIYKVVEVVGDRLRLAAEVGSARGQALASEVVPLERAADDMTERIRAEPDNAALYNRRAQIHEARAELDAAIVDFTEAIRLDPRQEVYFNNRGGAFYSRGNLARAIEDFDTAIRLAPELALARYNRGVARKALGDYARAIEDFDAAIRLDPTLASAFNDRGDAHKERKDIDRAIADYTQAIRLDPGLAAAYTSRGFARSRKGEYYLAIEDDNRAIQIDPNFALAYNNRAWIRATCPEARHRDGPTALEDARRACELSNWRQPHFLDTLAGAYAELGDFDQAVAYQLKAQPLFREEWALRDGRDRLALYQARKPYREPAKGAPIP
jgi:tetratricopeptide (TPR) repeat protein